MPVVNTTAAGATGTATPDTRMPRVGVMSEAWELTAMAHTVMSVPPVVSSVDAIVVYPGQGEVWRIEDAVAAYNNSGHQARYLLVAGGTPTERTFIELTPDRLTKYPFGLLRPDDVFSQIATDNTKTQSEWVAEQVQRLGITSLALYVSPYHLLRAFLTLVKTFQNMGMPRMPIIPMKVDVSPATLVPETGASSWQLLQGEYRRILAYQLQGDVLTYSECEDYLNWLYENFEPLKFTHRHGLDPAADRH